MSNVKSNDGPSDYEKKIFEEIEVWKNPDQTRLKKAAAAASAPLDKAGDMVLKTPGLGTAIRKSIEGIVGFANDFAQWSVRPEAIYERFRSKGHDVHKSSDILSLDLEEIDKVVGYLAAKYKGLALAEGAATGATGLPGMAVDIPAIVTLNLRAVGEYAAYYGFDMSRQEERLFAMQVLGWASSPSDQTKQIAMAHLARVASDVAKKRTWKVLEKHEFVAVINKISKALGIRLTKAKLAQTIPVVGAVIGGGFNSWYTAKVCDAAYHLYRERLLVEKYGKDIVGEQAVDILSGYDNIDDEMPDVEGEHQDPDASGQETRENNKDDTEDGN